MSGWTADDIPDQSGRTALVTGANSGLGYAVSSALARHGATVIMTARDKARGEEAVRRLRSEVPGARAELLLLDLADLDDVRRVTAALRAEARPIDLLVNNAGVMMLPPQTTRQGYEMQFGVNHLGHYALTLGLLPLLAGRPDARIVTVTSDLHKGGQLDFDDLQATRNYSPQKAYSNSKIANVYFALELDRRLKVEGSAIKSVYAHPGYAATNLQGHVASAPMRLLMSLGNRFFAQSADQGALPTLHAATAPALPAASSSDRPEWAGCAVPRPRCSPPSGPAIQRWRGGFGMCPPHSPEWDRPCPPDYQA